MNYLDIPKQPRIDLAKASPLAAPFTVYIEPTNTCNFKCEFCPESFGEYKHVAGQHKLSQSDFNVIVKNIAEFGKIKTIYFHMLGDALVNPYTPRFIRQAFDAKIAEKLILTTNGSLLTPKKYDALLESGLDFLRVSVYGASDAMHRKTTQSKIPLERIRENIGGFYDFRNVADSRKPHIFIKRVESGNGETQEDYENYFSGCADEIGTEPLSNWNDEHFIADVENSAFYSRKKRVCPFPFYTLVIHSDLQVSTCCVDWSKKATVGSLKTETLKQIWNGRRMHEFRLMHLREERHKIAGCKYCQFFNVAVDNIDGLTAEVYESRL